MASRGKNNEDNHATRSVMRNTICRTVGPDKDGEEQNVTDLFFCQYGQFGGRELRTPPAGSSMFLSISPSRL